MRAWALCVSWCGAWPTRSLHSALCADRLPPRPLLLALPARAAAYSPRPGTPAAVWEHQVADLVKADRLQRLNAVVNRVAEERAQRFLGRDLQLLDVCRVSACGRG